MRVFAQQSISFVTSLVVRCVTGRNVEDYALRPFGLSFLC
jgi:hypothetical protein